jgi:hypothetical protein
LFPALQLIWAEGGYAGALIEWVQSQALAEDGQPLAPISLVIVG